jgi:hypothetical protein
MITILMTRKIYNYINVIVDAATISGAKGGLFVSFVFARFRRNSPFILYQYGKAQ